MNESERERLFAGYRDSLGTCGRRPSRRSAPARWRWAVGLAAMTALAGTVALWPTDAAASAVRRMSAAIANARTMEMVFETQRPSGRWVEFDRELYRDGAWRCEVRKSDTQQVVYIVRDGRALTDFRMLDHATVRPQEEDDLASRSGVGSALDYAKAMVDTGRVSTARTMRVEARPSVGGAATYAVVFDRKEDAYHAEILVDARTDLPLSSEIVVDYGPRLGVQRFRQRYRFNLPLAAGLFEPPTDKPVVSLPKAQAELAEAWARPLAAVGATRVRDACVTRDGTVWVTVSVPVYDGEEERELPARLEGYARLRDVPPSAYGSGARAFRLDGEDVVVVGFVPIDPDRPRPAKASVGFSHRAGTFVSVAKPSDPSETPVGGPVALALRPVAGDRPESFVALELDRYGFEVPIHTWEARAEALEKIGDDLKAAKAYERCAVEWRGFVRYVGYRPLRKAAACYDRLGLAADAARVRAEATALEAARER